MPRFNRLSLSLASTAAVALASLPLAFTPANAAKGSEGTTSSIGVIETSSDAQQFNLKTQSGSTVLVTKNGGNRGSGRSLPAVLAVFDYLLNLLRIQGCGSCMF